MSNLWIHEDWVDVDRHLRCGDTEVYETSHEKLGDLFRSCQQEYGRCTSKVYIGEGTPIGWVFEKKKQYDDSKDTFTLQTWVTVHEKPPTKTVEYHYAELR